MSRRPRLFAELFAGTASVTLQLVYLDPPYQGCTPYAVDCPRPRVLEIARGYHEAGATVVISEAVRWRMISGQDGRASRSPAHVAVSAGRSGG